MARPRVSSLHPRLLVSKPRRPVVSRSPIAISQELSLSVRSVVTRSRRSSSSESFLSSVSSVKSPRTSSQTSASSHPLSVRSRSLLRPTLSPSLRTPTFALFMVSSKVSITDWVDMLTIYTAKRVTIQSKDIQLARRLRGERS